MKIIIYLIKYKLNNVLNFNLTIFFISTQPINYI